MVISAYYQRNFFSIFYIIVASIFANFSRILTLTVNRPGIKYFKWSWFILCMLLMVEVVRKYMLLVWFP